MFTGIVETTGTVTEITDTEGGRRLTIESPFDDLSGGQSIAVEGVCLTVEEYGEDDFSVFLAEETLDRTFFDQLEEGDGVNLERALPADGRFDGHFVQGHVDGTAEILDIEAVGEDWRFTFSIPDEHDKYLVEKGSIAIDGISLTIAARNPDSIEVAIIPETYEVTTLSQKAVGDPVHVEVDVMAKYVERMLEADDQQPGWVAQATEE
ncbi:riboflavin synthase [Halapricum desulfuricans]|uniref:Riboflavin synthase n=1 Tax=Halapricum desulfuricans TaxID=2841257 RepID=A0A897N786_9EURY|nr:riboflavin synthase [Halapricum desulfuricans]QSG10250.1 Riboflavin synthase alpha chain [Halapricum desulfuricans]QSG10652.1 Riboflavin synthase alpha chain [Halapricum desulfuricans]